MNEPIHVRFTEDRTAYTIIDGEVNPPKRNVDRTRSPFVKLGPTVGQRVVLSSLVHRGTFPGEVVKVNYADKRTGQPICTVKLDCQVEPIRWVLWFDEHPTGWIDSTLWQICWPEEEPS